MLKMLLDPMGGIALTSDGNAILRGDFRSIGHHATLPHAFLQRLTSLTLPPR